MNKQLWANVLVSIGISATVLVLPVASLAFELRTGDQPSVSKTETLADDLYIAGGGVSSLGEVKGDIFSAGGNILINGKVSGDVMAGGGSVTILSDIADDIRVGGGTITITGAVGGDVILGGGQINLSGSGIKGDAIIGAGVVRIDAPIAGDARIGGGSVYLNSTINGNVLVDADELTLGKSAVINGTLSYKSPKEVIKEAGAVVKGQVNYTPRADRKEIGKSVKTALVSTWVIGKFIVLFVCALIIGLSFKKYSRELVRIVTARPLAELGRGLVTMIVLPVVSVVLMVTLVLAPLGMLGLIGFAAIMIVGWILVPIVVGSVADKYLFKRGEYAVSWKTILLGTFIYSILCVIPFIGGLMNAAAMLVTVGAMASIKWSVAREWRK